MLTAAGYDQAANQRGVGDACHRELPFAFVAFQRVQGQQGVSVALLHQIEGRAHGVHFEGDVEFVPDYLGSDEMLYQPQAYALIGGLIYGGAGIGIGYLDGEWFDNPFYALRAGVDLPVGNLHVDVNANYRFLSSKAFDSVDDKDLDSVTFGAIVRFDL